MPAPRNCVQYRGGVRDETACLVQSCVRAKSHVLLAARHGRLHPRGCHHARPRQCAGPAPRRSALAPGLCSLCAGRQRQLCGRGLGHGPGRTVAAADAAATVCGRTVAVRRLSAVAGLAAGQRTCGPGRCAAAGRIAAHAAGLAASAVAGHGRADAQPQGLAGGAGRRGPVRAAPCECAVGAAAVAPSRCWPAWWGSAAGRCWGSCFRAGCAPNAASACSTACWPCCWSPAWRPCWHDGWPP